MSVILSTKKEKQGETQSDSFWGKVHIRVDEEGLSHSRNHNKTYQVLLT